MRHKKLKGKTRVPLSQWALRLIVVGLALGWAATCTPDIDQDPKPEFAIMEFDPDTGRVPEPIGLVINPVTGLIDLDLVDIDVPADCQNIPTDNPMPMAECEFLQYLESLDGFPTVGAATAPASAPIDVATATLAPQTGTLIAAGSSGHVLTPDNANVTFNAATNKLQIEPLDGWQIGSDYVLAVRGHEAGVKTIDGLPFNGSLTYFFLRQDASLTCDAATPAAISDDCVYFGLVAGSVPDPNIARETLALLEEIRLGYTNGGVWDVLTTFGWTRKDAAVVWSFRTHSNPVVENNPTLGMLPVVEQANNVVALPVKGAIAPATLTAHSIDSIENQNGSVLLLNLTKLEGMDLINGFPSFTPSFDGSRIVMTTDDPLIDGDFYGILLRNTITDTSGKPLVPSPLTVLLRSRGSLLKADGTTAVSSITDAEAQEAEPGRVTLAELLDNDLFPALTAGLQREDIAFVYAFVYPDPTQTE
ncbi:MAG: hypothetical protein QNJ97_23925 [Myxococcota bacterium]|nr:hypothetical protein [Myxococcota bacterium]